MLVDNSLKPLKAIADKKDVRIINKLMANNLVLCNKYVILIVLRNLISNAIKFTPEQGKVTISLKPSTHNLTIQIQDTGVGIEPLALKSIFDPSVQLTTNGTNNESGTGLGLLACKEFVEQNGGNIYVESELDEGSVFSFSIPLFNE